MDVKMGNAESTQSSDVGAIAGLTNSTAFHQQSPNVARLIHSDTSSKMEYEFPISDVPITSSTHHHHSLPGPTNHSILPSNTSSRHGHSSSSYHSNSSTSASQLNHSSHPIGNHEKKTRSKISSNSTSNLCFSFISCFGCRTNDSTNSSMNPLRDKVHAIRIVRASNDLTPAVFDSHYNIITLEQLRECDNNTNANVNSVSNDSTDPLPGQNTSSNSIVNAQNGNGSVTQSSSSSTKKDTHTHRLKKKKKKRSASATYASRPPGSDDDDDDRSGRT